MSMASQESGSIPFVPGTTTFTTSGSFLLQEGCTILTYTIVAGAGGAAHLPGMTAAKTSLPVLGVPVQSKALNGMDSLLSIAQMPAGIPVGTLAIGKAGATNAALLAAAIIANKHTEYKAPLNAFRQQQTDTVLANSDPRELA